MSWIKGSALAVGVGLALLVIVVVVALMDVFGVGFFSRATANFRGQTAAIEKTKANADFRLHSYNEFFDLCAGVQASEDRIQIATDTLVRMKGTDQETTAIVNLAAIESERATLVREYNAKASRSFTDGQFRSSNLPYQLDPSRQKETSCTTADLPSVP